MLEFLHEKKDIVYSMVGIVSTQTKHVVFSFAARLVFDIEELEGGSSVVAAVQLSAQTWRFARAARASTHRQTGQTTPMAGVDSSSHD